MRFATDEAGIKIIDEILAERSPMAAKMTAKKHLERAIVVPRSPQDVDNMRKVIALKLLQHEDLRDQLALIPKDAKIVEDCTNRPNESGLFWGAAFQNGVWVGNNQLGKIWMEYRQLMS